MTKSLLEAISQHLAGTPHPQSLRRHPVPSSPPSKTSHQQNTLAKGGGVISESGCDHFSELRGEIISESGGELPWDLHELTENILSIVEMR
ncbi:hypothetical protein CDO30_09365 [Sinorhizobium meliloti]|uniref:Uncharacterized protein n=1 Tax=Rhizobium meliloti (strain 1021) TaxID=266834 RepID=Q92LF0_RHIME|nr:hypothetical protein [Sinorhizobium meliloti]AGG75706.1 Hypothetical protein SM2011_c03263 [Sinorhizobium meliloti 2011]RVI99932.1 hypothetical protein CN183_27775 [Sinorhizobium medicae]CAC47694.1 Hypothetical/unknown protein [Sinorhizobium meliloti 1021]ASP60083.1 hypothetical protein CDO30_09365 [Sinorhizobium meliloti]PTD30103.1 hypothetical protein C5N13_04660 [Sinorhizobium meliloti]